MGLFTKWLGSPLTGRWIKENGESFNLADSAYLTDLSEPTEAAFRKRSYFVAHMRESVSNGDVYYYSFTAPSDKHIVVYTRTFRAGDGPVQLDVVAGATYTPGTPLIPTNLYTGGPASGLVATAGATDVTGGITIPNDYLFGAGNNTAVGSAGEAGLPTILPPDIDLLLKVTNLASGTNPGIRIALAYTEVVIPDDLV